MTTPPPSNKVGVKVTYSIRDGEETESKTFDPTNTPLIPIGLPPAADGSAPPKAEPGDYSYSGRHDGGLLPRPREGGAMAHLISCVQAAKALNDQYLTQVIQSEKHPDGSSPSAREPVSKKSKVDK